MRCSDGESARNLGCQLIRKLNDIYSLKLNNFEQTFISVTDCVATMPCILSASVSSNRVSILERWIECVSRHLKTAMKHAVNDMKNTDMESKIKVLKKIVSLFKEGGLNDKMQKGLSLLKEVPTRFGTIHDVDERFLKSESEMHSILMRHSDTFESARDANVCFEALTRDMDGDVV